jgi:tripartite-type tricarboxylate transporter receptor subunit TctC
MIVPAAAGGATDVSARIVSEHMSRTLGQQIVIENISVAGGTIGTARTMRANPDGYTIEMGHMGTHALAVALYPKVAYKPEVDFEPISMVSAFAMVILARKDFPPKDRKEFASFVKANSNKLNVALARYFSPLACCSIQSWMRSQHWCPSTVEARP